MYGFEFSSFSFRYSISISLALRSRNCASKAALNKTFTLSGRIVLVVKYFLSTRAQEATVSGIQPRLDRIGNEDLWSRMRIGNRLRNNLPTENSMSVVDRIESRSSITRSRDAIAYAGFYKGSACAICAALSSTLSLWASEGETIR